MDEPIRVEVVLKLTFWDAIKVRIAGKNAQHFLNDIKRQLQNLADASIAETMDRMKRRDE